VFAVNSSQVTFEELDRTLNMKARAGDRVERFVDEKIEQLRRLKTPAVILEGCKALYSGKRMFCARSIHLWWREIWLERVSIDACPQATLSSLQARACATSQHVHSI
jgi:hypothetical protein